LRQIKAVHTVLPEKRYKGTKMLGKSVAFLSVGLLFLSCVAHAQDVTEGHLLAGRWCSACHAVEDVVRGPVQDAAPSFLSIARMPSTTEMSLTAFLITPHPAMPDFSITRKEIRDVVAYILLLKQDGSKPINIQTDIPRSTR
jgi:mono/diheme cytochrome c family protein